MNTWAFNQLNQLSPESSPHNGPGSELDRSESSLSFPVSGEALQAQLEAWTNVAFDFDPSTTDFSSLDASKGGEYYDGRIDSGLGLGGMTGETTEHYSSLGLGGADDPFAALLGGDPILGASSADPFIFGAPSSAVDHSLLLASAPAASLDAPLLAAAPLPALPALPETKTGTKTPKASAPKKRRASSSVGSVAPETPEPELAAPSAGLIEGDDELNAVAVEEDKRRRNTAASARFRIKKKQREAALESTAKELRDKVASLERDVDTLRTENGWLRGLIVGKEEAERKIKEEEGSEEAQAAKRLRLEQAVETIAA
ncbi:hypothetical protein RQP46_001484 [Phenoliferia psychrophenolica]